MTIYSFFIFDRHCNCIYNREFTHTTQPNNGLINKNNTSHSSKLLFGILYSLKSIATKLISENQLNSFTLGQSFRFHFWESLTSYKFVIVTGYDVDDMQPVLDRLYSLFVSCVVSNGLSPVEFKWSDDGEKLENSGYSVIANNSFVDETDRYLQSLSIY
ncbi:Trafficking protein particle complex subunit BET5 [Spathaspora sp. JA1]|nr:Trafficking protein particle complex subunit BET5 [Spathaspora sp. JA1]